jgi:hypothetical protein
VTDTADRTALEPAEHPAKWSTSVLGEVVDAVATWAPVPGPADEGVLRVLDPFAGVGRNLLAARLAGLTLRGHPYLGTEVHGVELQPEWRHHDPLTIEGNAEALPADWTGRYHVVATSVCYGNRMADKHQAKDRCKACAVLGPAANPNCRDCGGSGLSKRNTYAHTLRRIGGDLVPGSAAGLQWGPAYRAHGRKVVNELARELGPPPGPKAEQLADGGLLLLNISGHERDGTVQAVSEWWLAELMFAGFGLIEVRAVPTPRQRQGANGDARMPYEHLLVLRAPVLGQGRML